MKTLYRASLCVLLLIAFGLQSHVVYGQSQQERLEEAQAAYQAKDYQKALKLLRPLGVKGVPEAQFILGIMYERGLGIDANPKTALAWFYQASELGHAGSKFNLGVAHWKGEHINQDRDLALALWESAAHQNHLLAQINLATILSSNERSPEEMRDAATWAYLASLSGEPRALKVAASIENKMGKAAYEQIVSDIKQTLTTAGNETQTQLNEEQVVLEQPSSPQPVSVLIKDIPVFSHPSSAAVEFDSIPSNLPMQILEERQSWLKVSHLREGSGFKVWVSRQFVTKDSSNSRSGQILGTGVRARAVRSIQGPPSLGQLKANQQVEIVDESATWIKIKAPDYIAAWIKKSDLPPGYIELNNRPR